MTPPRLEGKVALVTGGARGIGAAIAGALESAGCFAYRGDLAGGTIDLDVTDRAAVRRALERIVAERGGLDILVNNAGLLCTGPSEKVPGEEWDRLLAVNVTGVFNCVQAAIPAMRERAGATIINIASVSAEKGGGAIGNAWYGATKASVVAMTRGLGRELGPHGIRVNSLAPTFIETPLTRPFLQDENFRNDVLAKIKLGRLGQVEDLMGAIVFLASDASLLMTGTSLVVDGGWTAE